MGRLVCVLISNGRPNGLHDLDQFSELIAIYPTGKGGRFGPHFPIRGPSQTEGLRKYHAKYDCIQRIDTQGDYGRWESPEQRRVPQLIILYNTVDPGHS